MWADAVWTGCRIWVEVWQQTLHLVTRKVQSPGTAGCDWVRWVQKNNWFRTQDLEANKEFRHSAFSSAVSAEWPFEVREGMEEEHTPETDLTRCHQDSEEGNRFESSDFRWETSFSGSPEGRHTLVPSFVEGTEIAFSRICLPWGKGKLFQVNCLTTTFSGPWEGRRVWQLKTRWNKSVHDREHLWTCYEMNPNVNGQERPSSKCAENQFERWPCHWVFGNGGNSRHYPCCQVRSFLLKPLVSLR